MSLEHTGADSALPAASKAEWAAESGANGEPVTETIAGELAFSAQVLAGFQGGISPPRFAPLYWVGLCLVTVCMLILPLIYLGLIAALVYGVLWYGDHFKWLLQSATGSLYGYLFRIAVYAGPMAAGVLAAFFMVKPLLARRRRRIQPLAINPGAEPLLYAFTARLCEIVRAPLPGEIALSCEVNAAAGLRRGLLGRELTLTIGTPLLAGLSLREFAGVMAHEFGHFTQGTGMRLTYLIRQINGWFARVVFARDGWDEWLEEMAEESENGIMTVILALSQSVIWLSRRVLWVLMFCGHAISAFAMRQMEFDADGYEIKVAGSETFEATTRRLHLLSHAQQATQLGLAQSWEKSQRLPDDFAASLLKVAAAFPPEVCERIDATIGLAPTRWHDLHPSAAARIRCARLAAEPGVFHLDWPASCLCENFAALSRQVTIIHYRDELGLPLLDRNLVPVTAGTAGSSQASSSGSGAASAEEGAPARPRIRIRVSPPAGEN